MNYGPGNIANVDIGNAVDTADPLLVRLRAGPDELRRRLGQREHGEALEWHVSRAVDVGSAMDMDVDHRLGQQVRARRW